MIALMMAHRTPNDNPVDDLLVNPRLTECREYLCTNASLVICPSHLGRFSCDAMDTSRRVVSFAVLTEL
jgi:hypothetical protein